MQLYPAIRAHMGDWTYYIVRMRMREIAAEVQFGHQVHQDFTLDEAIQRTINESRVKQELVTYLSGSADRFFASLVVAAVGGSPRFFPVDITDNPEFKLLASERSFSDAFGVLQFAGDQNYYALDGQHRLKAIKTLLDPESDLGSQEPPRDFANEEISVLMVIRPQEQSEEEWLSKYRRLFSNLNRYAKPTDADTNIIMDEDDIFAILTRRLIASHSFFTAPGRHLDSIRVKTKGRPLKEGTPHFTSLQQLYDLNETLLTTRARQNLGWGSGPAAERQTNVKHFKRFRPEEEYIEGLFEELQMYWDTLIDVIPDLKLNPGDAKNHQSDGADGRTPDNMLFWPIGQEVMISVARALFDYRLSSPNHFTIEQAKEAIHPLSQVDWRLHRFPWRGLLLIRTSESAKWKMRDESRKPAISMAKRILRWIVGLYQASDVEESDLQQEWEELLILPNEEKLKMASGNEYPSALWDEVRSVRSQISA